MKFFGILLSFLLFSACEKASDTKQNNTDDSTLNIAVSSDYPPYIYNKNGKLEGFEIEIINAVAKKLNKKIHFHDIAFEGILKTVEQKQVDGAIAAIGKNLVREKYADFTIPYHRSMTVVVVPFATSIKNLEDLSGKIVGIEAGTTYEHDIKNNFKDTQVITRTKFSELLAALLEGKCHAIATGVSEAYELQNNNPNLKIMPIEGTITDFSIALQKGSPLLSTINEILEEMIKNGDLYTLEKQFFKKVVKE